MSLNPTSVIGGRPSTGTVTVSAPAPAEGAEVLLSSGDPAVATVPATVTAPAGATSADFTISTHTVPVGASATVYICGLYGGVHGACPAHRDTAADAVAGESQSYKRDRREYVTGTVTLSDAAPAGGATVTLSSSNTLVTAVAASELCRLAPRPPGSQCRQKQ